MNLSKQLELLCSAYLGQDWREDYETWERAVDDFAANNPTKVGAAVEAAEAVLRDSPDDAAVERALDEAGNAYDAEFFGQTYTEWLRAVVERLRMAAPPEPSER